MGLTRVTATLTSFDSGGGAYEGRFLAATGANDCLAPGDALRAIGVTEIGRMRYELADGAVRDFAYGLVRIEFMGEVTAGRVIFGDPGTEPILGVTALESAGIMVDPANQTLKRLPAIPLKPMNAVAR